MNGENILNASRLETQRLILRALQLSDAPAVEELAGDYEIAKTTNVPHPYPPGVAAEWIRETHENLRNRDSYTFAITRKQHDELIGAIGIHPKSEHNSAVIGYWLGKPYWGQGFMTEAVGRIVQFGFEELELNRIYANYFTSNPASKRVMEKAGMRYEGTLRQHIRKWGKFMDVGYCGILREEYLQNKTTPED